jgi:pectin methylesterase-like acyl-CoA thioesterase
VLVRKVTATNVLALTKGQSVTQTEVFHLPATSTGTASTGMTVATLGLPSGITAGAVSCGTANADNTLDCTLPVTFAPVLPGQRSGVLGVYNSSGGSMTFPAAGTATASALVADVAAPVTATTPNSPATIGAMAGLAIDGGGNLFLMDTTNAQFEEITAAGALLSLGGPLPASPYQLATDNEGDIYADGAGGNSITRLTPEGSVGSYSTNGGPFVLPPTSATGTVNTATTTYGPAADRNGNLYVAEGSTESVYVVPSSTLQAVYNGIAGINNTTLLVGGFSQVGELAMDGNGDLFVADTGAGKVFRVLAGTSTATAFVSGVNPTHLAADAAGNLLVEDATAKTVTEYPLSGATTGVVVYTAGATPTGLAVANTGAVYVAQSGATALTQVVRNAETYTFPAANATLPVTISNVGNLNATGYAQTDNAEFPLTTGGTNGCGTIPSTANVLFAGGACTETAKFTPGNNGQLVSSAVTLLAAASTTGAVTFSGQEPSGTTYTTTTTIAGPTSAPYLATGTEITFTVSEAASNSTSQNGELVNVSIDGGTTTGYTLASGQVSVPLAGLTAKGHTVLATYPGDGTYLASNQTANFTIAPAVTTVSWTPAATTQPYSAAIGTGVFNAYALSGSTVIPGSFVYTATPSGGSAATVDSASYLAIGSYTLAVTFTPTDGTDYATATMTLGSAYTVTKATTTAAVSASTMVVAASGGNYTSVNAAVTALSPTAGGSLYVAPGTYTEQVLVAYPNVQIHGLGGVPQNVVLTSETGAFSGPNPTYGIAANPFGFNNDEASATLVVAKGTVNGTSYTPSNFYIDNLSITNTYDTDTNNTNAITGSNQTCTGVTTSSNNTLYNAGTLCASQALTVWITADKSVLNNVRLNSLQDTIAAYNTTGSNAASGQSASSRQYYWKNYITGDIDYVFGDAAAVFDQTQFYTQYHNGSASGNATVFAQNKAQMTGSTNDYLSGYVANNSVFTSQAVNTTPMTALNFGRPYGVYSTTVLLNNQVDDVVPAGWESFSGANLSTATYYEYGTVCTTANCTTTGRETTSVQPEMISAAMAALYAPTTFLATPAPDVWIPTTALTTGVNGYVPTATSMSVNFGQSVTILAKPQVPGGGAIPTGTFKLMDGVATLASGTLDASGATYLMTSTLAVGMHNITLVYGGDSNFSGSTTASAFVLTVNGISTTTTVGVTTPSQTYGQSVTVTATVAASSGSTPTGTVQLSVDSGTATSMTVSGGVATFTLTGLSAGPHTLSAMYVANGSDNTSTGTGSVTLAKAALTVMATSTSRAYFAANPTFAYTFSGYKYTDGSSVVSGAPVLSTTATLNSAAGMYPIAVAVGTLTATNYTFTPVAGTLTVNGGAAQTIVFGPLPNLPNGTVTTLIGRSTSGLALSYGVTGPATISNGNTLTVNGTGMVTITASQSGNATFAAAPTNVSRSFTAQ